MRDKKRIKALLVDDDELLRTALVQVLLREDCFVITEAGDGASALRTFRTERPDVVLLDLKLPDQDGLETMRDMRAVDPLPRTVILTGHGEISIAVEAMKSGAYDFIVKPVEARRLVHVLKRAAAADERRPDPAWSQSQGRDPRDGISESLTPRECEILRLTVEGLSSSRIAALLSISPRTVETHRENIMKKLGMHNKTELIFHALRHGWVEVKAEDERRRG